MSDVAIIIVNWNTGPLLRSCLASLSKLPDRERICHVVVVDNGSSDTSLAQAQFETCDIPIHIIPLGYNAGFAKANNKGIAYVREHGGEDCHILLLNPDTEVDPHALAQMLDTFERRPAVGIIGPKLLESDRTIQPSVRRFPTTSLLLFLFLKLHRLFPSSLLWRRHVMADFRYDAEERVDQVMGAAFLIRNTTLKDVGMLDEGFWIWFEEVDFCKRARDAGWDVLFTPHASILHHGGVSFAQRIGISRAYPFLQSAIRYTRKHLGIPSYVLLLAVSPLALALAVPAAIIHLRNRS